MASPGVAGTQVNGVAASALSRPESPASINSSTKRKRDASDDSDAEPEVNGREKPKTTVNGVHKPRNEQPLIRDLFDALQRHDPLPFGLLKRPLPDSFSDNEPMAKKTKGEDGSRPVSIADKVSQDAYEDVEGLFRDLDQTTKAQIKELESSAPDAQPGANDEAIAKIVAFKRQAFDLWRRELAYPNVPRVSAKPGSREPLPPSTSTGYVLTTFGQAPTPRPLFTSLQSTTPGGVVRPIPEDALPRGVTLTQILPDTTAPTEKNGRVPTLGELFPSPRNLPPLQPPKAPKPPTKGNVLGFYHPELTEKSKYRSGTYFSQNISAGHWLDYSNATPTTNAKTKQRERAQSLAGHKPSSIELEMSEMESLFRSAFSSFAPSRDDSAAIVPSRQVGRVWWTRVGQQTFDKIARSEYPEDDNDNENAIPAEVMDFDEERVKKAIDEWDDAMVDPSLDEIMGKKDDREKDTDDVLEEVSDLIETLLSHQRNRHLALPTSQDRYSADPVNGDMLRNGSLSHQPSEEEMRTYQTLKANLTCIISTLPPFAVARLNSDKLEELSISTKIEVRTDEYRGVMEEDEPARLARQAAQAAANTNQRQQHRAPSVGSPSPYPNQQYPGHFVPNTRPIANAQHFPQTPVRPQAPGMYQQRPPSTVPMPQQSYAHQRPPPPSQYRPQAHGYAPQLAKAQTPYGHSNMPPYAASPTQPRMQPQPPYNMGPAPTPNHRYPQGYQQGYQQPHQQVHPQHMQIPPHQQHPQHPQHVPHSPLPPQGPHPQMHPQMQQHPAMHPGHNPQHPQQPGYSPYVNGQQMSRTMSPQVPQAHAYGQQPTPPQQHPQIPRAPYGSPGMAPGSVQRSYTGAPQPGMMPGGGRPTGPAGYATFMPEHQQRQMLEQARARADAEQKVSGHMGKVTQGEVVGLAGIGLGGIFDVNKMAAAKMQMGGNSNMSPSPRVAMHGGPSPVNGAAMPAPSQSPVPLPVQGGAPGPAPQQPPQGVPSPAVGQAQLQVPMQGPPQGFKSPTQV